MWGRKAARIADLEARNAYLLDQLEQVRGRAGAEAPLTLAETATVTRLRTELREARTGLRRTENQLGDARRDIAARAQRQVEYSNRAVSNMRRLRRAVTACARYRAELAEQKAVVTRQAEQLFDAIGYQPAERALLATGTEALRALAPAVTP